MNDPQPVVLIVGGGAGIGEATAWRLGRSGYAIAVADYVAERAEKVTANLGAEGIRAVALSADASDEAGAQSLIAGAEAAFGRIHGLVSCAGRARSAPFEQQTLADWNDTMTTHVTSLFLLSQAVLPVMRRQREGSIVGISSMFAWGWPGAVPYSAAKAAIQGLVRAIAREVAVDGIRVNAVAPGLIGTDAVLSKITPESIAERESTILFGRIGEPAEVANVIAFLISPESRFVTASIYHVNGGELIV